MPAYLRPTFRVVGQDGTVLARGCLLYTSSSRLYRECAEAKAFGVEIDAFRFDMPTVVERKNRIVGTLVKGVEGLLKRSGVEVIAGHARMVARNRVQVGDEILEAANVLLATGSRPVVPPIPGIGADTVLDSTGVFELAQVPVSYTHLRCPQASSTPTARWTQCPVWPAP